MGLEGAGEEADEEAKNAKAVGNDEDKGEDQQAEGPHDTNLPAA
jgi:hypothetical protein